MIPVRAEVDELFENGPEAMGNMEYLGYDIDLDDLTIEISIGTLEKVRNLKRSFKGKV